MTLDAIHDNVHLNLTNVSKLLIYFSSDSVKRGKHELEDLLTLFNLKFMRFGNPITFKTNFF